MGRLWNEESSDLASKAQSETQKKEFLLTIMNISLVRDQNSKAFIKISQISFVSLLQDGIRLIASATEAACNSTTLESA